jgi:hypothetical protein
MTKSAIDFVKLVPNIGATTPHLSYMYKAIDGGKLVDI